MSKRMRRWWWQALLFAAFLGSMPRARAAGPHGVDDGWAIDNAGRALLRPARAAALSSAGTGWVRIEMRLIPGHPTWDESMIQAYDVVVDNARQAGLEVLLLIDGGSQPGGQSAWTENNYENTGGNGDNPYIGAYVANAVMPIVAHFRDRVRLYELWNEPNAWTSSPQPGVFVGGTFMYPSNFSWLLARSWVAVHVMLGIDDVTLFSGGVFGHSIGGIHTARNAGAEYLRDTYNVGTHAAGSFSYTLSAHGSYPLDGIGQHIYIDQGGPASATWFRQYEDWVREVYVEYECAATPKKTFVTEFGWTTASVSPALQAQNLVMAFQTLAATPYVQTAIWFRFQDVLSPRLLYGILDSGGAPKPSYGDYLRLESYQGRFADGSVHAPILAYFDGLGQAVLGNPLDDGAGAWVYAAGSGWIQDYAGGSNRALSLMSSGSGTFQLHDLHGLRSYYRAAGGVDLYGHPLGEEYAAGDGVRQDFERGSLIYDPATGVTGYLFSPAPSVEAALLLLSGAAVPEFDSVVLTRRRQNPPIGRERHTGNRASMPL